ncbi:MAG: hypothetical protein ACOCP4_03090, partial [Candidatus Woesearchaeota archaeon]
MSNYNINNNNFEYIPLLLKKRLIDLFDNLPDDFISFGRDYRSWNNCLKICSVILFKQFDNSGLLGSSNLLYCGLSAGFWKDKRIVGNHYARYTNFLLKQNVIQRDWDKFPVDGDYVEEYGYRINPDLNDGGYVIIAYKERKNKPSELVLSDYEECKSFKPKPFNLDFIKIPNKKGAHKWIQRNAKQLVVDAITDDYYDNLPGSLSLAFTKLEDGKRSTNYYSVDKAKEIAKKEKLSLFHYRNNNVIANKDNFLQHVVPDFEKHYRWRIASFNSTKFNLTRHAKTRRVYGQPVSIPSALLQFVRIHGHYIEQVDLKCSQFTIFANILNQYILSENSDGNEILETFKNTKSRRFITRLIKTFDKYKDSFPGYGIDYSNPLDDEYDEEGNDVFRFLQDVFFHDFYTILKQSLKLPTRQHAKLWAFTILFGKESTNNIIKRQMMYMYTTVVKIIDDFKKTYKSNEFAIGLQVLEAEIFIDNIWNKAQKQSITSFTRHDSLIFAISKRSEVDPIIEETKKKFKFIGKFEYQLFNEEVIDKYGYYNPDEEIDDLDVYVHFPNHERHPFFDYDLDHIELMTQLVKIGVNDDYHGLVDLGMMEEITELPFLSDIENRYLSDEVWNMRAGYNFFQDTTNDILKDMVKVLSTVDFD